MNPPVDLSGAVQAGTNALTSGGGSTAVKLFLLITALSLASAAVLSVTSFTRIIIVLSFLRQSLGTPQLPPNQVLLGLALFMSLFVMGPTAERVYEAGVGPYLDGKIGPAEALKRGEGPLRDFMMKQTREDDLRLFLSISGRERPARGEPLPMTVVIPAFMVSELTTAFRMGLTLLIPMLLIDILVASVLMALGMMMLPPALVSLPLKIAVFALAGGWNAVVASLVRSF